MATYSVLYWKNIPSQIKVEDGDEELNEMLDDKFQDLIDQVATDQGLFGSDEYIDQWDWSEEEDRAGTAKEVFQALLKEFEEKHFNSKL